MDWTARRARRIAPRQGSRTRVASAARGRPGSARPPASARTSRTSRPQALRGQQRPGRLPISSSADRPFSASRTPPPAQQRAAPADQAIQRRQCPRHHHVVGQLVVLGAAADHPYAVSRARVRRRPRSRKVVRRSIGSSRVTGRSGRTRASGMPGKSGAGSDVDDRGALGNEVGQRQAVEDVPIPDPIGLARARCNPKRTPRSSKMSTYALGRGARLGDVHVVTSRDQLQRRQPARAGRPRAAAAPRPRRHWSDPAAATASCTILRSNGFIGASGTFSWLLLTSATASVARLISSLRRFSRKPATSSISRLRSPVSVITASRASSCRASSTAPSGPDQHVGIADDGHVRPIALDVGVDVTVEIGDVEQLLQIVGGDLGLGLQRSAAAPAPLGVRGSPARLVGRLARRPRRSSVVGLLGAGHPRRSAPRRSLAEAVSVLGVGCLRSSGCPPWAGPPGRSRSCRRPPAARSCSLSATGAWDPGRSALALGARLLARLLPDHLGRGAAEPHSEPLPRGSVRAVAG